ncbi:MAG: aminopeptidase [Elusimicrobia bacterium]|jgi:aspartyl aminopeptidase|nr:aminopeptidase [Elusimicrobiota bacterium]
MKRKSGWEIWDKKTQKRVFDFCEGYKDFLSKNKTERLFVAGALDKGKNHTIKPLDTCKKLKQGDIFYKVNKEKVLVMGRMGAKPLKDGCKFIVSHVDSPRLDLKTNPIYEDEDICLLKTYYYGGIKKYQWLTIPLAMYGTVVFKNGQKREIVIGEKETDPVFCITDLLPHLGKDQAKKTIEDGFPGENLNIIIGSIPLKGKEKEKTKENILKILEETCGIKEDDFISSEFQFVPAGKIRDAGIDKSMVLGYGQDDRVCAYTSMMAFFDTDKTPYTTFCVMVDQEEIGSRGATSAQSEFLKYVLEEVIEKAGGKPSDFRTVIQNSKAISADVDTVIDPNYKEVSDPRNTAKLGHGVVLTRITGGRGKGHSIEPSAEYIAYIRDIFDRDGVLWQPGEIGKIEQGGGGTIATYIARYNIDTIDCGTGVLSMHAPYELISKADVYSTYLAYKSFYSAKK